jgi:hypothetical protein
LFNKGKVRHPARSNSSQRRHSFINPGLEARRFLYQSRRNFLVVGFFRELQKRSVML